MASPSLGPGPMVFPDRKLSVAVTLEQATKALAAHRAWMRRRVQQGPASLDPPPDGGECPEQKDVSWALGITPPSQGNVRCMQERFSLGL